MLCKVREYGRPIPYSKSLTEYLAHAINRNLYVCNKILLKVGMWRLTKKDVTKQTQLYITFIFVPYGVKVNFLHIYVSEDYQHNISSFHLYFIIILSFYLFLISFLSFFLDFFLYISYTLASSYLLPFSFSLIPFLLLSRK